MSWLWESPCRPSRSVARHKPRQLNVTALLSTSRGRDSQHLLPRHESSPGVMAIDPGHHRCGLVTQRDDKRIPLSWRHQFTEQIIVVRFAHGAITRSSAEHQIYLISRPCFRFVASLDSQKMTPGFCCSCRKSKVVAHMISWGKMVALMLFYRPGPELIFMFPPSRSHLTSALYWSLLMQTQHRVPLACLTVGLCVIIFYSRY